MLGLGVSVVAVEGVARLLGEMEGLGLLERLAQEDAEAVARSHVPVGDKAGDRVVEKVTLGLEEAETEAEEEGEGESVEEGVVSAAGRASSSGAPLRWVRAS